MSNRLSKNELIDRLVKMDSSYDYSLIDYVDMHKKVIIRCKHGHFNQTPNNLLNGFFCKKCKKEKLNEIKLKQILIKSNYIHNYKYDYSYVKYNKMIDIVDIKCPIHGIFPQSLNNHINQKKGCPKCKKNYRLDINIFTERSNVIHNNFYDYSLVEFKNVASIINIICPIHGIFPQTPNNHLCGVGCPYCNNYKGEEKISKLLDSHNINYIRQKTFENCKYKRNLYFDFYLCDYNICIEFDGKQHFHPIDYFGGENEFKKIQKRDNIKNDYCLKNNITLLRIPYTQNIEEMLNKLILNIST